MFINQLGVQVSKVPTLPLDDERADLTRQHCKLPDETDKCIIYPPINNHLLPVLRIPCGYASYQNRSYISQ